MHGIHGRALNGQQCIPSEREMRKEGRKVSLDLDTDRERGVVLDTRMAAPAWQSVERSIKHKRTSKVKEHALAAL